MNGDAGTQTSNNGTAVYNTKLKIAIDSKTYTWSIMNDDDGTNHATMDWQFQWPSTDNNYKHAETSYLTGIRNMNYFVMFCDLMLNYLLI